MKGKLFKVLVGVMILILVFLAPFMAGVSIAQLASKGFFASDGWVYVFIFCIGVGVGWLCSEISAYLTK